MSTEAHASLISQIPASVLKRVAKKRVIESGFATGPGYCVSKVEPYDPPVSFAQGLAWLERYRGNLKGASLVFEDRSILWFGFERYERYQSKPAKELPRAGLIF